MTTFISSSNRSAIYSPLQSSSKPPPPMTTTTTTITTFHKLTGILRRFWLTTATSKGRKRKAIRLDRVVLNYHSWEEEPNYYPGHKTTPQALYVPGSHTVLRIYDPCVDHCHLACLNHYHHDPISFIRWLAHFSSVFSSHHYLCHRDHLPFAEWPVRLFIHPSSIFSSASPLATDVHSHQLKESSRE